MINWLPQHQGSLHLTHNDHKSCYQTVEEFVDCADGRDTFVSPAEYEASVRMNEMWELQWYPDTPVGFCVVRASTFEAIKAYFEGQLVRE